MSTPKSIGSIGLLRRYRKTSLVIAGCVFISLSLAHLVSAVIHNFQRKGSPQIRFYGGVIPDAVIATGCGIAFIFGIVLLTLAVLMWAFDD